MSHSSHIGEPDDESRHHSQLQQPPPSLSSTKHLSSQTNFSTHHSQHSQTSSSPHFGSTQTTVSKNHDQYPHDDPNHTEHDNFYQHSQNHYIIGKSETKNGLKIDEKNDEKSNNKREKYHPTQQILPLTSHTPNSSTHLSPLHSLPQLPDTPSPHFITPPYTSPSSHTTTHSPSPTTPPTRSSIEIKTIEDAITYINSLEREKSEQQEELILLLQESQKIGTMLLQQQVEFDTARSKLEHDYNTKLLTQKRELVESWNEREKNHEKTLETLQSIIQDNDNDLLEVTKQAIKLQECYDGLYAEHGLCRGVLEGEKGLRETVERRVRGISGEKEVLIEQVKEHTGYIRRLEDENDGLKGELIEMKQEFENLQKKYEGLKQMYYEVADELEREQEKVQQLEYNLQKGTVNDMELPRGNCLVENPGLSPFLPKQKNGEKNEKNGEKNEKNDEKNKKLEEEALFLKNENTALKESIINSIHDQDELLEQNEYLLLQNNNLTIQLDDNKAIFSHLFEANQKLLKQFTILQNDQNDQQNDQQNMSPKDDTSIKYQNIIDELRQQLEDKDVDIQEYINYIEKVEPDFEFYKTQYNSCETTHIPILDRYSKQLELLQQYKHYIKLLEVFIGAQSDHLKLWGGDIFSILQWIEQIYVELRTYFGDRINISVIPHSLTERDVKNEIKNFGNKNQFGMLSQHHFFLTKNTPNSQKNLTNNLSENNSLDYQITRVRAVNDAIGDVIGDKLDQIRDVRSAQGDDLENDRAIRQSLIFIEDNLNDDLMQNFDLNFLVINDSNNNNNNNNTIQSIFNKIHDKITKLQLHISLLKQSSTLSPRQISITPHQHTQSVKSTTFNFNPISKQQIVNKFNLTQITSTPSSSSQSTPSPIPSTQSNHIKLSSTSTSSNASDVSSNPNNNNNNEYQPNRSLFTPNKHSNHTTMINRRSNEQLLPTLTNPGKFSLDTTLNSSSTETSVNKYTQNPLHQVPKRDPSSQSLISSRLIPKTALQTPSKSNPNGRQYEWDVINTNQTPSKRITATPNSQSNLFSAKAGVKKEWRDGGPNEIKPIPPFRETEFSLDKRAQNATYQSELNLMLRVELDRQAKQQQGNDVIHYVIDPIEFQKKYSHPNTMKLNNAPKLPTEMNLNTSTIYPNSTGQNNGFISSQFHMTGQDGNGDVGQHQHGGGSKHNPHQQLGIAQSNGLAVRGSSGGYVGGNGSAESGQYHGNRLIGSSGDENDEHFEQYGYPDNFNNNDDNNSDYFHGSLSHHDHHHHDPQKKSHNSARNLTTNADMASLYVQTNGSPRQLHTVDNQTPVHTPIQHNSGPFLPLPTPSPYQYQQTPRRSSLQGRIATPARGGTGEKGGLLARYRQHPQQTPQQQQHQQQQQHHQNRQQFSFGDEYYE